MSLLQERLNAVKANEDVAEEEKTEPETPIEETPADDEPIIFNPPKKKALFSKNENETVRELEKVNFEVDEEMLEIEALKMQREENRREQKAKTISKAVNIFFVAACIYIIFLIYGVCMTNYHYNENGQIEPQVMSVKDIKEKKEFDIILAQYERCRVLYEEVLMLDYRLGQGIEDPMSLAPQYEALLDKVQDLSIKTDALDTPTQYDQVKSMMLSWIQNDMAIYLQKISSAISQNNSEDASLAIAYKSSMYDNFSLITSNIVVMGDKINGTDMTEVRKWSPETYVNNTINGDN